MKKYLLIFLIGFLFSHTAKSQQDPSFSQYMFNGLYINPAYAGSHDYITTSIVSRHQWLKMPGAPTTALLGIDGKLKNRNMGLGFLVSNDVLGVTGNTEIYAVYSYFVRITKKSKLSFGIKAGMANFRENLGDLTYWDPDPVVQADYTSTWLPKFGFGMYYYSNRFYLGLSIPTLLSYDNRSIFSVDLHEATTLKRHIFLTGGYVFHLSDKIEMKPFTLIKYTGGAPLQADFNLAFLFADRLWLGLGYRTSSAMIAMIEIQINHNVRIGYSFDFLHTDLYQYAGGSHEIMLGIDFGGNSRKFKNVRYF